MPRPAPSPAPLPAPSPPKAPRTRDAQGRFQRPQVPKVGTADEINAALLAENAALKRALERSDKAKAAARAKRKPRKYRNRKRLDPRPLDPKQLKLFRKRMAIVEELGSVQEAFNADGSYSYELRISLVQFGYDLPSALIAVGENLPKFGLRGWLRWWCAGLVNFSYDGEPSDGMMGYASYPIWVLGKDGKHREVESTQKRPIPIYPRKLHKLKSRVPTLLNGISETLETKGFQIDFWKIRAYFHPEGLYPNHLLDESDRMNPRLE